MKPPFSYGFPIQNAWIHQDREIVLAAVTQNGDALSFVGAAWQCDEDAARGDAKGRDSAEMDGLAMENP